MHGLPIVFHMCLYPHHCITLWIHNSRRNPQDAKKECDPMISRQNTLLRGRLHKCSLADVVDIIYSKSLYYLPGRSWDLQILQILSHEFWMNCCPTNCQLRKGELNTGEAAGERSLRRAYTTWRGVWVLAHVLFIFFRHVIDMSSANAFDLKNAVLSASLSQSSTTSIY